MSSAIIGATASQLLSGMQAGQYSAVDVADGFSRPDRTPTTSDQGLPARRPCGNPAASRGRRKKASRKGSRWAAWPDFPSRSKMSSARSGQPTTCGSRILQNFVPPYDAEIVRRLREADAVLIGKTNMDEFAMGSSTENSAFQTTRNPWDTERSPGGSSGGSAAAVAARMAPLADRQRHGGFDPAAGRLLRHRRHETDLRPRLALRPGRLCQFARPVGTVGQRRRRSRLLLLEVIAGHDPGDSTSVD